MNKMRLFLSAITFAIFCTTAFPSNNSNRIVRCTGYKWPNGVVQNYDDDLALCNYGRAMETAIVRLYDWVQGLHQEMNTAYLFLNAKMGRYRSEIEYAYQMMSNYRTRVEQGLNPPPLTDLSKVFSDYFTWVAGLPKEFRFRVINIFLRSAALMAKALKVESGPGMPYYGGIYATKSIQLQNGTRYSYAVYLRNGTLAYSAYRYDAQNPNGICILYEQHYDPELIPVDGASRSEILGFVLAAFAHPIITATPTFYQSSIGVKAQWSEVR